MGTTGWATDRLCLASSYLQRALTSAARRSAVSPVGVFPVELGTPFVGDVVQRHSVL